MICAIRSNSCSFELKSLRRSGLMESRSAGLTEDHIRCYMKQLICGVAHMHSRNVCDHSCDLIAETENYLAYCRYYIEISKLVIY